MKAEQTSERNQNYETRIDTAQDVQPFIQYLYRTDMATYDHVTQEVKRLFKAEAIEPASFRKASSVVAVQKKDMSLKMCIDYQMFNAVMVRDIQLHSRMNECMNRLRTVAIFQR